MSTNPSSAPAPAEVEAAILKLVAAREGAASICPSEVARALASEWRPLLFVVRQAAVRLAASGQIEILRKGKPVPPEAVRGVVRLRRAAAVGAA